MTKIGDNFSMKIAIVIDIFHDKGNGTSMSARHLVEGLIKRGIGVKVLCTDAMAETEDLDVELIDFPVKQVPIYQKVIEEQHAWLASPDDDKIRAALADVDLVHIYMPFFLGTHCARIAKELGKAVLGCYHVSAENITYNAKMKYIVGATPAMYEFLKLYHYKPEWITDIHCPSRRIASTLIGHLYAQNLRIVSNGYDDKFRPLENFKTDEDFQGKIVVTSVGRLTEEKRQDLIIEAVAKSKHKDKIALVLAGKGPKQEFYEGLAKKLGVNLNIVFKSQDQLVELLNSSYLFVQASDVETESISCLEAIGCGTVPIISDAPMCATKQFSLTKHSIFKKGNAKSLASAIDYWIENEAVHQEYKPKYAEFAKRFSLEKCIDYMVDVYKEILAEDRTKYVVRDYNNPCELVLDRDALGIVSTKNWQWRKLNNLKKKFSK